MNKLLYTFWMVGVGLMLTASTVVGKGWEAGVATTVITPQTPLWMAGYAARTKPAEGKQHELRSKAVVLRDSSGHVTVMVSSDMLGFTKALGTAVRQAIRTRHQLTDADILLNSSHTHSGPVLSGALVDIYPLNDEQRQQIDAYTTWLEGRIIDLVDRAFEDLEEARVYAGMGVTRFQVNRRNNPANELYRNTDLNGPNDYAVPVIKITGKQGDVKALLFSYACHPTTLDGYEWSGDFPGYAQIELEDTYKGTTALFFQGACGDQNPLPRHSIPLARQYGKELAAAVETVLEENQMKELKPVLKTAYQEIDLPFSPVPSKADLQEVIRKDGDKTYFSRWAHRLIGQLDQGQSLPTSYPYPVQVWKIGDQLLFSLSGELLIDYAINLKNQHGWDAFVLGYNNDVMGYIPPVRVLEEGGYEGQTSQQVYGLPSKWDSSIESRILKACDQLVSEVNQ